MALPDLTGQNIENTYQRILQTDGTNVYDGTGSLFILPSANTSSLLITASATSNQITFTKGDASQFTITVDTGSSSAFTGTDQEILFISGSTATGSNSLLFDYSNNTFNINADLSLSGGGGAIIDTSITTLGFSGLASVDWGNRNLFDANSTIVLDWINLQLYDGVGGISNDWNNRTLHDSAGTTVVDYSSLVLIDDNAVASADWRRRRLIGSNGTLSLDWDARVTNDSADVISIDWDSRRLFDTNATRSIDWSGRRAYDVNDVISFNWRDRLLQSPNGNTILDWNTNGSIAIIGNLSVTGTIDGGTF